MKELLLSIILISLTSCGYSLSVEPPTCIDVDEKLKCDNRIIKEPVTEETYKDPTNHNAEKEIEK